tara:strand:+ start:65335 stop:66591 length:1257 start_codon:yes stop_codon:yes gene_type:complete
MNNKELFEKSLKYVPGGVHSPVRSFKGLHTTPRFIQSANGAYITDEEGKNYIDFCMSFGPMVLGHRNPTVEAQVREALTRGWTYGACEKYSLELAQFIVDKIDHIDQIRFVNSGTEAVMTAVRLARGVTGKNKIIKFNGCYHGHIDSMLIKAGSGLAGTPEASSQGVTKETAKDTIVCDLNDLDQVKSVLESDKDVAAIFLEPLPANSGILIQTKEYLQGLRDLCDEHNVLLVFDEVISGFRVSFGGMAEDLKISPDIVTYGKVIGGGFPVGAIAAKEKIMSHLAPLGGVYQAGTLSANPVAMIAGLSTLKQCDDNFYLQLYKQAKEITATLNEWMQANGFSDYKIVQYKSLFWPVPTDKDLKRVEDIPSNLLDRFYTLFETLLNKGIYLSPNGYEIGFASIAHNEEVVKDLKERLWN